FVAAIDELAQDMDFFPNAMASKAEWRANPALAQKLEQERAQEEHRASSAIFLRQARFALVLRKLLLDRRISHAHATSSRAVVCAIILQSIADLTISATIEHHSECTQNWF